jgi:hypothetical protein
MPDGTAAPALATRLTSVGIGDRINAFARKHPLITLGIGLGLVAIPGSFALGWPAYLAGAQTLATTVTLALETGGLVGVLSMMGGGFIGHWTRSNGSTILSSGQVIRGRTTDVHSAQMMQRQFDALAARRDFSVKNELTARDKEVLRSYQALWSRSKLGASVYDLWRINNGGPLEVARVAPLEEFRQAIPAMAPVLETCFGGTAADWNQKLSAKFNRERAYADAELAGKTAPEPVVNLGGKLQLVSKLV